MQNLIIRKATTSDLPTLLRFEQGVITAERPFDPTLKTGETRYYNLDLMISASHIQLLVAEIDGELVGSGYARIEDAKPYLQHKQHAYLGFMYVKPEYRGRGINKAIIEALEAWAIQQGITEMRLDVYDVNTRAIKAYQKAGFVRHLLNMRKGLRENKP